MEHTEYLHTLTADSRQFQTKLPDARAGHAQSARPQDGPSTVPSGAPPRVFRCRRSAAVLRVRNAPAWSRSTKRRSIRRRKPSDSRGHRFINLRLRSSRLASRGLLPQKRGPRSGHKLTPERMSLVAHQAACGRAGHSFSTGAENCRTFRRRLIVHPRSSIDRQLRQVENPVSACSGRRFLLRTAGSSARTKQPFALRPSQDGAARARTRADAHTRVPGAGW